MILKYGSFCLTVIFLLLWTLRFDVFTVFSFQNSTTLERKIILTSGFHQFVTQCALQNSILNSTGKNCDIRLVSCRKVTVQSNVFFPRHRFCK